ncbi:hypothetical protein GPECTOR_2g1204 [Gonium pectorale]|uniref:Uncharacterized protein n=1 Tax=Gonium pectorale TaxID=33097 RepID=A0A150H0U1_GONPE|nr:hypothetical protein GPECTOR_2g1204 [Gonium pectorale]|eukprot:KXZ55654.1 hypothetical protein GPECTOR_2g1204 [Gonium pectorale]
MTDEWRTTYQLSSSYRLRGHEAVVLCVAAAGSRLASGAEAEAVAAVAFNPAVPDGASVFAAAGSLIHQVDLRAGSVVQTYGGSSEEVNGLSISPRGAHLAAADDAGEVQVYDLAAGRQFKGIRNVHRSICSSVAFRAHKPWDLLSGGLDSTVAKYDFSRPKCIDRWDMNAIVGEGSAGGGGGGGGGQIFNPPFVHQIATPPADERPTCQWLAAARGDGAVVVLDADVSSAASGSSGPVTPVARGRGRGSSTGRGKGEHGGAGGGRGGGLVRPLVLDRDAGGHTRPVCSVAFAPPGAEAESAAEAGRSCRLYSAGEDCRILMWDVREALRARAEGHVVHAGGVAEAADAAAAAEEGSGAGSPADVRAHESQEASDGGGVAGAGATGPPPPVGRRGVVLADVRHARKVNQLCPFAVDGRELVAVAAVSKFVTVYGLRLDGAG